MVCPAAHTRPARARWPGRHATCRRPSCARAAAAAGHGHTLAAASTLLCRLECCVPTLAHNTNRSTKSTPHGSTQPTPSPTRRARTRNDPWKHGSSIVRTRSAPHSPQQPHIAPHCTVSAQHSAQCHTPLHTCTSATARESMAHRPHMHARKRRTRPQHAQRRAKGGRSQRHWPAPPFPRALPSKLATRLMND